jgi:CHASE2 domain-containing sensor protein
MKILLLILILVPFGLRGSPFQVVLISDADVEQFGGRFPLPRRQLAAAIAAASRAEARAIILKFFIDQPANNPDDDAALAQAIKQAKRPIVLQANVGSTEGVSRRIPERFIRKDLPQTGDFIRGSKGWLPLALFTDQAAAIGFIDGLNPAPLLESYQGHTVPSLFLVALELALGNASFEPGRVTLGTKTIPLSGGKIPLPYPQHDDLKPISLSDLLAGKVDRQLKDTVVIIGYDGKYMDTFPTPIGRIKKHRLFFYELELAYAAFSGGP